MKLSAKSNKQELATILGANAKAVQKKDKGLFDRMAYASKMFKQDESKVTKKDLLDLVKEVQTSLGKAFVTPALAEEKTEEVQPKAENSVKGKVLKSKSKDENKEEAEAPAEDQSEQDEKKSKSKGAKAPKKSAKDKAEGVTVLEETDKETNKAVQLAKMFPKTITVGDTTYEVAQDIKTMEDLHTALENDEDITFAFWWTKKHLKQFPYFNGWLGQPKSFDNDLDVAQALYVSEQGTVAYAVSQYTEAVYTVLADALEEIDGVRYSSSIEYQIYRAKA